jgi:aminodeoxychorismate lyase
MIVFLNGKFVPEQDAKVSIFDRAYLYGDGLFETMLVSRGVPFRWGLHIQRLDRGAAFLGISVPYNEVQLRQYATRLINDNQSSNALLRLTLSRGVGIRGYSARGADAPTLSMSLHPLQQVGRTLTNWKLFSSSLRLPANEPLAQLKHCNKLPQILARAEAERAGADEALLTNTDEEIVEAAAGNLFWIHGGVVCTPPLAGGILAGVTRMVVLELCQRLGLELRETATDHEELLRAEGVFLSLSSHGLVQAISLDGRSLATDPLTTKLHAAYGDLVERESAQAEGSSV